MCMPLHPSNKSQVECKAAPHPLQRMSWNTLGGAVRGKGTGQCPSARGKALLLGHQQAWALQKGAVKKQI